ncbi:SAM-dependent methyltransferase [Enterovirga sp.]|uniref:class I SAM-dependent methyltransferase n=1 Tax=Enterovirga sp. TaxID=2026350 RepID=UPI002612C10E|nr:SAM-dependent methyltransferase [Enterovirga sp.]MDB5591732.1 synthase subunit beta [Enterovirga sp.]
MTALLRQLSAAIAEDGPISVARYMALALGHPAHGYYMTRDPLGRAGDFTTAPEISQMFGELIGLWCCDVWDRMGRPAPFVLAEQGPGRGTLMSDALRAARLVPDFLRAASVHLVETSPVLRQRQQSRLEGAGAPIRWHEELDGIPEGPAIILGNEFLDALPIRQFVRTETGWHERMVGLGPDGALAFGMAPDPEPRLAELPGRPGDLREFGAAATLVVRTVSERLVRCGGAALFVDYGTSEPRPGSTFQAVRGHRRADPLEAPGEVDLTAHVDLGAVSRQAVAAGASVHGPVPQGEFLGALGIRERASRLSKAAGGAEVAAALSRLTGQGEGEMGQLFQAIAISDPRITFLPGFPDSGKPVTRAAGPGDADLDPAREARAAC